MARKVERTKSMKVNNFKIEIALLPVSLSRIELSSLGLTTSDTEP